MGLQSMIDGQHCYYKVKTDLTPENSSSGKESPIIADDLHSMSRLSVSRFNARMSATWCSCHPFDDSDRLCLNRAQQFAVYTVHAAVHN